MMDGTAQKPHVPRRTAQYAPPQKGFLQISHRDVHAIATAPLSGRAKGLLLIIYDETKGWGKLSISQPLAYWEARTGISCTHIPRHLAELEKLGFIRWQRGKPSRDREAAVCGIITLQSNPAPSPKLGVVELTTTPENGSATTPQNGNGSTPKNGSGTIPENGNIVKNTSRSKEALSTAECESIKWNSTATAPGQALQIWNECHAKSAKADIGTSPSNTDVEKLETYLVGSLKGKVDVLRLATTRFFSESNGRYRSKTLFVFLKYADDLCRTAARDQAIEAEQHKQYLKQRQDDAERERQRQFAATVKQKAPEPARATAPSPTAHRKSEPKHIGTLIKIGDTRA
jgi:hypothetical protein